MPQGRDGLRRLAGRILPLAAVIGSTAAAVVAAAPPASASTYYLGSDSNGPVAAGTGYPYRVPVTGGLYAGYGGEIGTWTNWQGCTTGTAFNYTDAHAANADEAAGAIPGLSLYWFMGGPGADPHYNGTAGEAYAWGRLQAERVNWNYSNLVAAGEGSRTTFTPMVYMDIEGQPAAGYANGWNERVDACGQITRVVVIPTNVDRATFNGFYDYIHLDTVLHPGVYSTPDFWTQTFGTGADASIPDTYEWTPVSSTGRTTPAPYSFDQGGQAAVWFGNVSPSHRAAWQWTQNGGDWDVWDTANLP